jgi:TolB-like protein
MYSFRTLVPLVAVVAALAPLGASRAQTTDTLDRRPLVFVTYFTNGAIGKEHADMQPLSLGLADMMITELSNNPNIRVVERDRLTKLMEEQNLGAGDRVDANTAARMGRILGAGHVIIGSYVTDPKGRMRMDVRAVNVETTGIEHTETITDKTDNVLDIVANLAAKMNKGMKLPALEKRTAMAKPARNEDGGAAEASAKKVPFQAVMLYSRGLAARDNGKNDEATQLFKASLAKFPDYDAPKKALKALESPKVGA